MRIPITAAKKVAKEYEQQQVMIVGWSREGNIVWTATYGEDKAQCKSVAELRDRFIQFLGLNPHDLERTIYVEGQEMEVKK